MMQQPLRFPREYFLQAGNPPISAQLYVVNSENSPGPHSHEFIEIAVIGTGQGRHLTIHGEHILERGDTFIFRPGSWHDFTHCEGLEVFNCYFGPELLHYELAWLRAESLYNYLLWRGPMSLHRQGILALHLHQEQQESCFQYLNMLHHLLHSDPPHFKADCIGLLLLLLGQLVRGVPEEEHNGQSHIHQSVLAALQMMEQEPAYPWTLSALAQQINLDSSYLARLFKTHTGSSPMAYLARYRAEQAAILLAQSERSIAQIGSDIGWPDPNYFARRFKAFFGMSASTYRTTFRNF